ncbi:MAG TPA: hypothetical protein VLK30_04155 [Candidatus Limnocylindrales bacterium]|nr:hypothetical protein [Candidatus Limnocylindrales bacterium]
MDRSTNADELAKALVEAARNLRTTTARLDSGRVREAARDAEAAIAVILNAPMSSVNHDMGPDVRRALEPLGVAVDQLATNVEGINGILQKLGEDLLRAAQTLGR